MTPASNSTRATSSTRHCCKRRSPAATGSFTSRPTPTFVTVSSTRAGTCEQNTVATANVLEAMRGAGVSRIAFASTGSVYGEPELVPTPEDAPFPVQTSLYGASKLAGEGMLGAYAHGFGFTAIVFRFVSILGERYTHGHLFDFYCALKRDPTRLRVLGDGRQEKSYLYVRRLCRGDSDCRASRTPRIPLGLRSTTWAPTRPWW